MPRCCTSRRRGALSTLALASLFSFGCGGGDDPSGGPGGGSQPAAGATGSAGTGGAGGSRASGTGGAAGAPAPGNAGGSGGASGAGGPGGAAGQAPPRPADAGSPDASVDAQATDGAPASPPSPGTPPSSGSTVCINADGPDGQETYARLASFFGDDCIENPDDDHTPPFKHVKEEVDPEIGPVFAVYTHQNDSDRGTNNGKNRVEMKVNHGAADALKGTEGETVTYTWRFKMDAEMIYSPRFNAMFQLKSFGGNDKLPVINIKVAPSGGSDKLIVEYIGDAGGAVRALATAPVTDAKGVWLEVLCRMEYKNAGSIFLTIKRPDGSLVLSVDEKGIDVWRQGSYIRGKWGLYRGISPITRELDIVRFANFGITPGPTPSSDCRLK